MTKQEINLLKDLFYEYISAANHWGEGAYGEDENLVKEVINVLENNREKIEE